MVSRSRNKNTPQLRSFRFTDLPKCYEIVALSFGVSERVSPHILANFLAKLYVESSVIESSKAFGLEVDGEVVGFLFGRLPDEPLFQGRYSGFFGKLTMVGELLFLKGVSLVSKWTWLKNVIEHDRRSPDLGAKCEVTLFAISPAAQGLGGGRILLEAFIDHCVTNDQSDLYLETDTSSNFRFYKHLGFKHIDSFNSPIAAAFSGGSGETFVYRKALSL
ncbi:GNAT family N-acetyltransferase [Pelagibius sp.]|uniref:GNAT family N-acetyltransferase n=1 Tax=Pelagibius sp. TaxID=1931238 RepID=UPI003B507643